MLGAVVAVAVVVAGLTSETLVVGPQRLIFRIAFFMSSVFSVLRCATGCCTYLKSGQNIVSDLYSIHGSRIGQAGGWVWKRNVILS